MSLLGWLAVLAVAVAAMLFGQTARSPSGGQSRGALPTRVRTGVAVSITGPLFVATAGLAMAVISGAWLPVAAGTIAAVVLTAVAGLVLAP